MPKDFLQNINISLFQTKNKNCSFIRPCLIGFEYDFHPRKINLRIFRLIVQQALFLFGTVTCSEKIPSFNFILFKLRSDRLEIFLFEMQLVSCRDPYQPQQGTQCQAEHLRSNLNLFISALFSLWMSSNCVKSTMRKCQNIKILLTQGRSQVSTFWQNLPIRLTSG